MKEATIIVKAWTEEPRKRTRAFVHPVWRSIAPNPDPAATASSTRRSATEGSPGEAAPGAGSAGATGIGSLRRSISHAAPATARLAAAPTRRVPRSPSPGRRRKPVARAPPAAPSVLSP